MGLKSMSIVENATAQAAPTGGAAITLTECGVDVKNGVYVADASNTDFITRINATFRNRQPSLQSDGTYTKAKRSSQIVVPKVLADGSTVFNLARIELEMHPEMTSAEVLNLKFLASQLLTDPDVVDFIASGSTS